MKRIIRTGVLLLVVLIGSAEVAFAKGEAPILRFRYWLWDTKIEGNMHGDGEAQGGNTLPFNQLGWKRDDTTERFELVVGKGRFRFSFGYHCSRYSGKASFDAPILFNDAQFAADVQTQTKLRTEVYDLRLDFFLTSQPTMRLGAIGGCKYLNTYASVSGERSGEPGVPLATALKPDFAVPYLGACLEFLSSDQYVIGSYLTFCSYSSGDITISEMVEMAVYAEVVVAKIAAVQIGYRKLDLDFGVDRFKSDQTIKGPYLAIYVGF